MSDQDLTGNDSSAENNSTAGADSNYVTPAAPVPSSTSPIVVTPAEPSESAAPAASPALEPKAPAKPQTPVQAPAKPQAPAPAQAQAPVQPTAPSAPSSSPQAPQQPAAPQAASSPVQPKTPRPPQAPTKPRLAPEPTTAPESGKAPAQPAPAVEASTAPATSTAAPAETPAEQSSEPQTEPASTNAADKTPEPGVVAAASAAAAASTAPADAEKISSPDAPEADGEATKSASSGSDAESTETPAVAAESSTAAGQIGASAAAGQPVAGLGQAAADQAAAAQASAVTSGGDNQSISGLETVAPAAPADAAAAGEQAAPWQQSESPEHTSEASKRNSKPWLIGAGVAAAAAAAYVGTAAYVAGNVPKGTQIAGVAVGGMGQAEAESAIRAQADKYLQRPMTINAGGKTTQLTAQQVGITVDEKATVAPFVGFSLDPRHIAAKLSGSSNHTFVTSMDQSQATSSLNSASAEVAVKPVDGDVKLVDGKVEKTDPVVGQQLVADDTLAQIKNVWSQPQPATINAKLTTQEPAIGQKAIDQVMSAFVDPALAGPVTFGAEGKSVELKPEEFRDVLSVKRTDTALEGVVDGDALRTLLEKKDKAFAGQAKNASFKIVDNKVEVVPSQAGLTLDSANVAETFKSAIGAAERRADLKMVVAEPALTTDKARELGVNQVISEFTVNLTSNQTRTKNIRRASEVIDGTLLMPGDVFDMNKILGRRTAAKGYYAAPVIDGGRLRMDYGGGISQVATTLYNGMYFAGMKDIKHKPHSFYISRYPAGREATISFPTVDLRFQNTLKKAVYIEMKVRNGKTHTRFWGTKEFDVTSVPGPRRNIIEPKDIIDDKPDCVKQSPSAGFTITVTRIWKQNGREVKRENRKTRYIAEDKVTCVNPGKPKPISDKPKPDAGAKPKPKPDAKPKPGPKPKPNPKPQPGIPDQPGDD